MSLIRREDVYFNPSSVGKLDGVTNQVNENLLEFVFIRDELRKMFLISSLVYVEK